MSRLNVLKTLQGGRRSNAQLQDDKRRTNQSPAIAQASTQAAEAILLASTAIPVGLGTDYYGITVPNDKWIFPVGQLLEIADYPELYDCIGTTYNSGTIPAGKFRAPDKRGRVSVMAGNVAGIVNRTLAQVFGADSHTLATNHVPTLTGTTSSDSHSHTGSTNSNTHKHFYNDWTFKYTREKELKLGVDTGLGSQTFNDQDTGTNTHSHTISTTSDSHSHTVTVNTNASPTAINNHQPSIAVNYIVRARP